MCQVSKYWREILNNEYIWKKKALLYGFKPEDSQDISNVGEEVSGLTSFCGIGTYLKIVMRRKMNYRRGKYRRRYVPSLYENIYEETESYSSCMDMNGDFIVFGSENVSVLL